MLQPGPGSLQASRENDDSPRGGRHRESGWETAVPRPAAAPFLWRPPWQLARSEALKEDPCLEARSAQHGPSGQTEGRRRGGPTQDCELHRARATGALPCSSADQLLQEGLQLVLILDAHKLVHHVPILDGQHGGHSRHLDGGGAREAKAFRDDVNSLIAIHKPSWGRLVAYIGQRLPKALGRALSLVQGYCRAWRSTPGETFPLWAPRSTLPPPTT